MPEIYLLLYNMRGQPFVVDWTLGFCPLLGWLVATESALQPRAQSDPQPPVTHYLEREVIGTVRFLSSASGHSLSRKGSDWDRQVFQLRLVIMISVQRFTTRFV